MWVTDVARAVTWYTEKLGCELTHHEESECGGFAIAARDGLEFHLEVCACDDQRHTGNSFVEIEVDNAVILYEEYQAAGVTIERELKHQDWGSSNFKVTDPDGNWILFTSDTPE